MAARRTSKTAAPSLAFAFLNEATARADEPKPRAPQPAVQPPEAHTEESPKGCKGAPLAFQFTYEARATPTAEPEPPPQEPEPQASPEPESDASDEAVTRAVHNEAEVDHALLVFAKNLCTRAADRPSPKALASAVETLHRFVDTCPPGVWRERRHEWCDRCHIVALGGKTRSGHSFLLRGFYEPGRRIEFVFTPKGREYL